MRTFEEHTDELLFDYIEGNLARDELSTMEKELLSNQSLLEELEIWKSSQVVEDFHDTNALESSILLQIKAPFSIINYLNIILFGSLIFISGIQKENNLPITAPNENPSNQLESIAPTTVEILKVESIQPVSQPFSKIKIPAMFKVDSHSSEEYVEERRFIMIETVDKISLPSFIAKVASADILILPISEESHKLTDSNYKYEKGKAPEKRAKRNNAGFMKGKVPYVVPMDSQNFY